MTNRRRRSQRCWKDEHHKIRVENPRRSVRQKVLPAPTVQTADGENLRGQYSHDEDEFGHGQPVRIRQEAAHRLRIDPLSLAVVSA
jgi:hypothetical protein